MCLGSCQKVDPWFVIYAMLHVIKHVSTSTYKDSANGADARPNELDTYSTSLSLILFNNSLCGSFRYLRGTSPDQTTVAIHGLWNIRARSQASAHGMSLPNYGPKTYAASACRKEVLGLIRRPTSSRFDLSYSFLSVDRKRETDDGSYHMPISCRTAQMVYSVTSFGFPSTFHLKEKEKKVILAWKM